MDEFGCQPSGRYQELRDGVAIYPASVLCRGSKESVVIHLMSGSWETRARDRLFIRFLGGRAHAELIRVTRPRVYAAASRFAMLVNRFRGRT